MHLPAVCFALLAVAFAVTGDRAIGQTASSYLPPPKSAYPYTGGDGSTMERAIILQWARSEAEVSWAEDRWIAMHRPGWGAVGRTAIKEGCKTYDRIRLVGPDDASMTIFFDRGGCFWRLDPVPK